MCRQAYIQKTTHRPQQSRPDRQAYTIAGGTKTGEQQSSTRLETSVCIVIKQGFVQNIYFVAKEFVIFAYCENGKRARTAHCSGLSV